jgi:hypothetical protein
MHSTLPPPCSLITQSLCCRNHFFTSGANQPHPNCNLLLFSWRLFCSIASWIPSSTTSASPIVDVSSDFRSEKSYYKFVASAEEEIDGAESENDTESNVWNFVIRTARTPIDSLSSLLPDYESSDNDSCDLRNDQRAPASQQQISSPSTTHCKSIRVVLQTVHICVGNRIYDFKLTL